MVSEMNSKQVKVQPNHSRVLYLHSSDRGALQLAKLGTLARHAVRGPSRVAQGGGTRIERGNKNAYPGWAVVWKYSAGKAQNSRTAPTSLSVFEPNLVL